jgi:hypothetical protein
VESQQTIEGTIKKFIESVGGVLGLGRSHDEPPRMPSASGNLDNIGMQEDVFVEEV